MTEGDWQNEQKDDDGEPSNWVAFALLAAAIGLLVGLFLLLGGVWGYFDYLMQEGSQQACENKYGEKAEFVGDTGFASETGVCDTPDGQKYVELETAPMNLETLQEYLAEAI